MELVSVYISGDYRTLFYHAKELWLQMKIQATPDIASMIESKGITRHMYKAMKTVTNDIQSKNDFYRNCLALLIYAIDMQSFDDVQSVFDSEEIVMKELCK